MSNTSFKTTGNRPTDRSERASSARHDSASVPRNAKEIGHLLIKGKLLRPGELLEQLFTPDCRPSLGWLRAQTAAKSIPHVRIGRLMFFDLEMVRQALTENNLVSDLD